MRSAARDAPSPSPTPPLAARSKRPLVGSAAPARRPAVGSLRAEEIAEESLFVRSPCVVPPCERSRSCPFFLLAAAGSWTCSRCPCPSRLRDHSLTPRCSTRRSPQLRHPLSGQWHLRPSKRKRLSRCRSGGPEARPRLTRRLPRRRGSIRFVRASGCTRRTTAGYRIPVSAVAPKVDGVPYAFLFTPIMGWNWYVSPWGSGPYHYGAWVRHAWRPPGWRGPWIAPPGVVARLDAREHFRR